MVTLLNGPTNIGEKSNKWAGTEKAAKTFELHLRKHGKKERKKKLWRKIFAVKKPCEHFTVNEPDEVFHATLAFSSASISMKKGRKSSFFNLTLALSMVVGRMERLLLLCKCPHKAVKNDLHEFLSFIHSFVRSFFALGNKKFFYDAKNHIYTGEKIGKRVQNCAAARV